MKLLVSLHHRDERRARLVQPVDLGVAKIQAALREVAPARLPRRAVSEKDVARGRWQGVLAGRLITTMTEGVARAKELTVLDRVVNQLFNLPDELLLAAALRILILLRDSAQTQLQFNAESINLVLDEMTARSPLNAAPHQPLKRRDRIGRCLLP